MTGQDLQQMLLNKWGCSYDLQIRRTRGKIVLQVMWKYLEQVSFPLTEEEYLAHLETIATYLQAWDSAAQVQAFIEQTREHPRLGKAITIPLDLGERASEWLVDEF